MTMNKARLGTIVLLILGTAGFAGKALAAGQYFKVDYPASTASNELQVAVTYELWIPDGATRIRGIIVHQHGAGTTASIEGSTAAHDLHWQALAKKWDCALWARSRFSMLVWPCGCQPKGARTKSSNRWTRARRGSRRWCSEPKLPAERH